jgi:hypothetical protein
LRIVRAGLAQKLAAVREVFQPAGDVA